MWEQLFKNSNDYYVIRNLKTNEIETNLPIKYDNKPYLNFDNIRIINDEHYVVNNKLITINDINYQFNDLSNLVKTNYKVDCLQIFINCQFSEYHEYVNAINNQIKSYITKKYENKINNEDGLQWIH